MYNYILDPIQNKKINIHNNLGKNIIKQYLMFITGGGQTFDKLNDNNIHEAVKMYCGGDEKKKKITKKLGEIGKWDVSRVKNMSELFKNQTDFNENF